MLEGKDFTTAIATQIYRAGSKLSVGEFVLLSLVWASFGFLVGRRFDLLVAPLLAAGFGYLPYLNLKRKAAARLKLFEAQLPEAIDMIVNAMKSGYSLQAAIKFAGDEMPQPLGPEFARVYDEQRLGMDLRNALLSLQERVNTLDCKMFVTALLLQRETGGNLAEVLSNLATLMRETCRAERTDRYAHGRTKDVGNRVGIASRGPVHHRDDGESPVHVAAVDGADGERCSCSMPLSRSFSDT